MARPLYGRTLEIELIRELMLRPEDVDHIAGDRQPVVVLEGGTATGKTALLDTMASGCAGRVPYAYLDLEGVEAELGDAAIPELLAALASQLARRCKLYGSLRFDRLVIGLLATRLELNQVDPKQARSQVIEMLKERRPLTTLKRILGDMAQDARRLVPGGSFGPSSDTITTLVELSVDGIASRLSTGRRGFGRFQDWYGHQDRELGRDPIDQLMDLNWSIRHPTRSGVPNDADELLCSAFRADLRDNFRTGRQADEWSLNCLLLLDNVDSPLGRAFLHHLVQAQEHPWAHGLGTQDPVTVVTTSRGGLLATLTKAQRATVRDVTGAEDVRLAPREHGRGRTVWLRRQLPAFTVDEVHEMVKKLALPKGNTRNLATMLHQLGGGHPGGTEMLLTAVAEERTTLVEPDALLRSTQAAVTLEERLYDRLLVGVPGDVIDTLITCSAGRNRSEGLRLLNRNDTHYQAEPALLPVGMWDPEPGAAPTLLRLLLLRRLARRPKTHQRSWSVVHETLREASAQQGNDPVGELYHSLANEQVDTVVRALAYRLGKDPLPHWLDLLDAITAVPHRPGEPSTPRAATDEQDDGRPADVIAHPNGSDDSADTGGVDGGADTEPPAFIHTLVSALRTAADPLLGSNRSALYRRVAGGYRDLSRHIDDNSDELFELIARYEQFARQWQRDVHRPGAGVRIHV